MPLSLIASWVVFFGFVNTHQRHARHFRGESQGYLRALQASASWQLGRPWPLGLLLHAGCVVYAHRIVCNWQLGRGGLLFGVLDVKISQLGMSMAAFIGWPASAVWAFFIIHGLHP